MTTATTILALIPVFTSTGRGSDILVPMAIPSLGGMVIESSSLFVVPVIYAWMQERKLRSGAAETTSPESIVKCNIFPIQENSHVEENVHLRLSLPRLLWRLPDPFPLKCIITAAMRQHAEKVSKQEI